MKLITLDACASSDLEWETSLEEGIFFLDFGSFDLLDEGLLNAHMLAVEEFTKCFPTAKEVILARTSGVFSHCPQLFSDYLHRLASPLLDHMTPLLLCDVAEEQKIEDLVLPLCRRRFEHFHLLFSGRRIPIEGEEAIAVALPQDEKYDPAIFGSIFESLEGLEYKCIPEELLNEHWDGVDILIVDFSSLGEMGERMLLGFEAAGGKVIEAGKVRASSFDEALMSE